MNQLFKRIEKIRGELNLGGDKSISHRAVMFASMAEGDSTLHNCSSSFDVWSTVACFRTLGCEIEGDTNLLRINGRGYKGFNAPSQPLDCGNSGTTARLISGILCAQNFESTLIGDESLSKRPMKRVIEPLSKLGAKFKATEEGTLPLTVYPGDSLVPIQYEMSVASAQVKSAIILAGIHLDEISTITENEITRNHTEKLLNISTEKTGDITKIFFSRKNYPQKFELTVPSDISSASFFIVLAILTNDSEITIKNVSLNETRTGIINILKKMNGDITIQNSRTEHGETCGDLLVRSSNLINVEIPKNIIANIIDEIPILSIAGIFAKGDFRIEGAKELRVKESDRIKALCHNFKIAGLSVNELEDGFEISGVCNNSVNTFESFGDHRIAMAFAVFSMLHKEGGRVNNFDCAAISNPDFIKQVTELTR